MADTRRVFEAFENIGRQAQFIVEMNRAAALGVLAGASAVRTEVEGADLKASAAYHPCPPPATFTVGLPPRSAQERKKFLRIEKDKNAFLLMVPTASPDNLMGRRAYRHWGEWHVKVVEDDRPLLLESFDEYDEAAAYVARVLTTVGDEPADDVHEYASVGEVPC